MVSKEDLVGKFLSEMNGGNIIHQSGMMSCFTADFIVGGWVNSKCKSLYKSRIGPIIFLLKDSNGNAFFAEKPWVGVALDNLNHFFENKSEGKLKEYKEFLKVKKECTQFYSKVNKERVYSNAIKTELVSYLKKGIKLAQDALAASAFAESLDEKLLLKIFLENNTSEEEANKIIEVLMKPSFESISLTTDKALLNFKNLEEVQWLFSTYYSTTDFKDLKNKVELQIKEKGGRENLAKEIKLIELTISKNMGEINALRKNLSEKQRIIVDFAIFNMRMRDERIDPMKKGITIAYNASKEYASRIGLDVNLVSNLTVDELIDKKYSVEDLKRISTLRNNGVGVFVTQNGKQVSFLEFNENIKRIEDVMHKEIDSSKLIGAIANKGVGKGIVKIILGENDFSKFNEGDVLVASMTRIEYVPLMKKASAIITNEGGITCHAAIVSRELNKPCIIGTKIATKVLNDEDLVEVDANIGIVKILEKKK